MDIAKLKAFIVVAEELNFRRSAERLAMSQPPLTRLIASLEEELGTRLFDRTTRSVRLTGAGVLLLREAREIVAALSRIETNVRAAGRMKPGNLRIGFSRTAFMARFPALIEAFQDRFPKLRLDLQEAPGREILHYVKDGRFDLGFVEGITSHEGLESQEIAAETLGVLVARKHPLAKKKQIQFQDLKDETIILHHRREAEEFHDRISHLIKGMSGKPRIHVKAENESCPILVALGKGVSLTIAGAGNFAPEQTRFVPVQDMFLPLRVFWKNSDPAPPIKTFLSFAIENKSVLAQRGECAVLSHE